MDARFSEAVGYQLMADNVIGSPEPQQHWPGFWYMEIAALEDCDNEFDRLGNES